MSPETERDLARRPMRADFISEVESFDKATGVARMRMQPDPRRYDKVERDGETFYVDKYLRIAFTLETMVTGAWDGVPSYSFQPRIKSRIDYADARNVALADEISSGEYAPPAERPCEQHDIASSQNERGLGFLSVDICGASAMRRRNPADFDRAYELFTRELGTLVGQFNGSILKTKGDGFIAFIDHPSFTNLCDNIVDMGLSLLILLHRSLNPALAKAGMEQLSIRIGADYGEALVRQLTIPSTGFVTQEVASDALNRAVKIEEACMPDQFWIGQCLYELVHVKWLERATDTAFDGASIGIPGYKTYRMT